MMPLPKPLGPYSLSTRFDRLIFVSGQGATDPATGALAGDTVEAQTTQCLKNVQAILEAAGSSLQHVLRCGVFLVDMREFANMNAVVLADVRRPSSRADDRAGRGAAGRGVCSSRSTRSRTCPEAGKAAPDASCDHEARRERV